MDSANMEVIRMHRAKIFRNHVRRTSNLLKLGRLKEAKEDCIRFSGIMALWEIQQERMTEKALGGLRQKETN